MKISGRNKIAGKVVNVTKGMVNSEVELEIGNGQKIVGVITKNSLENMDIKIGDEVTALVKATSVMFMKED